jgi:hypothetical protein
MFTLHLVVGAFFAAAPTYFHQQAAEILHNTRDNLQVSNAATQ